MNTYFDKILDIFHKSKESSFCFIGGSIKEGERYSTITFPLNTVCKTRQLNIQAFNVPQDLKVEFYLNSKTTTNFKISNVPLIANPSIFQQIPTSFLKNHVCPTTNFDWIFQSKEVLEIRLDRELGAGERFDYALNFLEFSNERHVNV